MSRPGLLSPILATLGLVTICGCGGSDQLPLAPVTGKVTVDGQPLQEGQLLFRPAIGRAGRGRVENGVIVEASTYGVNDGLVLGKHKVAIQPIPDVEKVAPTNSPSGGQGKGPSYVQNLREARTKAATIPIKYQDVDGSGLEVEIQDDDNELTLELSSR
jgi:hypothetical protein